jgi:peroxiredoxin
MEIERILGDFFDERTWRNILIQSAQKGIFNGFTDVQMKEIELQDTSSLKRDEREYFEFGIHVYRAYKAFYSIAESEQDSQPIWQTIYIELKEAKNLLPLRELTDLYIEACRQTEKNREYFELVAYRYFDREDPSLFKYIDIFLKYLAIKDEKESFNTEISTIKEKLKKNVYDFLPEDHIGQMLPYNYPMDADRIVLLDPRNPESPVFAKKILLAFFNTECKFCGKEFSLLSKRYDIIRSAGGEVVGINTMYTHSRDVFQQVNSFKKEHNVLFPLLIDQAGSKSVLEYGIRSVPTILLINEDGSIHKVIRFMNDGHLKLKLSWFLNDFFNINF